MAKQIVREFDNSTGSLPAYSNFTVLVPGYVDSDNFINVSDDNDTYEVNSIEAFVENVGLVCGEAANAEAPTLSALRSGQEGEDIFTSKLYINEAFDLLSAGQLYLVDPKDTPDDKVGYLENERYKFIPVTRAEDIEWENVESTEEESSEEIAPTETDPIVVTKHEYCKIEAGNEGRNEILGGHMGNQIAYELLNLGYTVLYKGFGEKTRQSTATPASLEDDKFWAPFRDKSTYQFRYVLTGGNYSYKAMNAIIKLATFNNSVSLGLAETLLDENGRGDVIALCDVDESKFDTNAVGTTANIYNTIKAAELIDWSKYAAIFAPRVIYRMDVPAAYNGNTTFPASFHYLACAAYAQSRFAEWYAVAGYPRGITTLRVDGVTVNYGNVAQNTLAPRTKLTLDSAHVVDKAINLIITERDSYYLWGNRTAETIDNKGLRWSHYLNIRQLCTTIKKQVIYVGRMYAFDPNSDVLWNNFKAGVEPLLRRMAGDQGIDAYKITPVKDKIKGAVKAKIGIVPVEAAEDFDISLYLEDSISATTVDALESD